MNLNYGYAKVLVEVLDVMRDEFVSYNEIAKVAWNRGNPVAFEFKNFYKGEIVGSYVESPQDFVVNYNEEVTWYQKIEVAQELTESEYQEELNILIEEERNHYNEYLSEAMRPATKEECNGIVTLDFVSKEVRKQEVEDFVNSLFEGI